ncbi:response regulator [Cytophagaceae bacterium ABcell3]|nr:response regulator [Cytophagaceae bacterium ABcell3]
MQKLNCVLLVDDDQINNFINESMIRRMNLADKVKITLNGEEALLYLAKHGSQFDSDFPELIILDQHMPEMEGAEFLELFNQINANNDKKAKIVVLTASDNPDIKEKLQSLGVRDFLIKPLTEEKLKKVIDE